MSISKPRGNSDWPLGHDEPALTFNYRKLFSGRRLPETGFAGGEHLAVAERSAIDRCGTLPGLWGQAAERPFRYLHEASPQVKHIGDTPGPKLLLMRRKPGFETLYASGDSPHCDFPTSAVSLVRSTVHRAPAWPAAGFDLALQIHLQSNLNASGRAVPRRRRWPQPLSAPAVYRFRALLGSACDFLLATIRRTRSVEAKPRC